VKKQCIETPRARAVSTYSPAILAEGKRLLVISGQTPDDVTADSETQVRQIFARIGAILEKAGGTFDDIVMIRGYFVDMAADLDAFRRVRVEFLRQPYPASTLVGVSSLAVPGCRMEVEALAIL